MLFKFIFGTEPIDNFDKYIAQMKTLGIEKAIAYNQEAYDKFSKNN